VKTSSTSNGSNFIAFEKHNHLKEKVNHKGKSIYIVYNLHEHINDAINQNIFALLPCQFC